MIYTLTVNPCLDYYISSLTDIDIGKTNRADNAHIKAGGKGVNVSLALKNLGEENVRTLVASGGKNGERIVREIADKGLDCVPFSTCGESRINVKINSNGTETEINLNGPAMSDDVQSEIAKYLSKASPDDVVVLAGSLPDKCPDDFYAKIISSASCKNIAVDCTKNALRKSLEAGVFLIKPNIDELSEFFSQKIGWDELPEYANKLCEMGAKNVLVSAGECGAVLATDKCVLRGYAPKDEAICTTGSGDTMLAAFIYFNKICRKNAEESLKLAIAAGSAKAFYDEFPDEKTVCELAEKILVEEVF